MDKENFSSFVNIAQLRADVIEKAELFLNEVNEDNLKSFSEEVKKTAEGALQKYIFKVYDWYTDGNFSNDQEFLSKFVDLKTGYQQTMLDWIEQNCIVVQQQSFEYPEHPTIPETKSQIKEVAVTGTVGTAIATGLLIFTNPWLALAIELLTVALAYSSYKKYKKSQKQYQMELEAYEIKINSMKHDLVNGVTEDLVNWVNKGVEYSQTILDTF
jgi:hypothetical protein